MSIFLTLDYFHKAVETWFQNSFDEATEIQNQAWPVIKEHKNVLISAPTGSGKTLAAFLSSIDDLVKQGITGNLKPETQIIYISPLKALSNDIEKNLQLPLKGILKELKNQNLPEVHIEAAVRTGDTPASERTKMLKNPPHIIVTTPESLYLLLTCKNGRRLLSTVNTVIVDEIHAMVGNKRGSHLSLSLERLETLTKNKLVRIGLSATQRPIEKVAHFLTGWNSTSKENKQACTIINAGHKRKLDLQLELPNSPLTAIMANEVWVEIYDKIENYINNHNTTLIFVNNRRLAERMAHNLTERLGNEAVTAHHGSMSKDHRHDAEQRLKAGTLKCLVATASLELGIDIGDIDLVCQMSSPRSIAAFLQRVGRSGHSVKGTPKGRLFPLTRDDLIECTALLDSVRRGELDEIIMPEKPLDILAQQIVAEIANEDYDETELYNIYKKAFPYKDLTRKEYNKVVKMLAEGFTTRRGRRSAYLHQDKVNEVLKARKGARLTALVSGGSIPDNFEFDIMLEPENVMIGTLNEDFAIESLPGDIFQLGNSSWRILRIESGKMRVEDAQGLPPTIPFWLGEAPGRTIELSESVSRLRETIDDLLGEVSNIPQLEDESRDDKWKVDSLNWLTKEVRIEENAADQVVMYLATVKAAMGTIPSQNNLIIERFFDGAGDMHVVIHSPFGTRLNRGWGLALRKRFCRKFNFELQAAATDDAIILSLGSTHSFPLEEVFGYLNSKTVRNILIQALLDAPMFEIRWRWNASRALAVLRRRAGKKVPPQIQRMNSEDLIALIFPDQLACFENIAGEREVPDHPLVNQTIKDCLHEAMDIDKLETILDKIKNKQIKLIAKDLREASPLSHEIISARPYAFLDNAPAEERRTNAIQTRRWLDPSEANDLGKLDIEAIKAVRAEAWPSVENPDELHDALVLHSFLTDEEGKNGDGINSWEGYFGLLINENRATKIIINENQALWVAVERLPEFQKLYKNLKLKPNIKIPQRIIDDVDQSQDPWVEVIRGRMEALGPVKVEELANSMNIKISKVELILFALENEGFVFRGNYTPNEEKQEWCERRLLARIHRYTLNKLRKEIEPVSAAVFMQFLFQWHNLLPDQQLEGPDSLRSVLQKLEGFEAQAVSWEGDILPSRIKDYDHNWLDAVCLSGSTIWGKFHFNGNNGASNGPIKTTPISLINRSNWKFFQRLQNKERSKSTLELSSNARQVLEILEEKGASFFDDLLERAELLKVNLEEAMSELVSHGLLTSDSYAGLRSFLVPSKYKSGRRNGRAPFKIEEAGRWNLLQPNGQNTYDKKQSLEVIARILLRRYGIVFRKLLTQEVMAPPWRELVSIYRVLEARGEIRGGRFVTGVWGEQFALPEVIPQLRSINKQEKSESYVSLSASDPLNLTGVITPGKRIPSIYSNRILYKNGVPIAVKEGKEIKYLIDLPEDEKWVIQKKLIQRKFSPKLKGYLGKGIM